MSEIPHAPPQAHYKDCRKGMLAAGILTTALGAIYLLGAGIAIAAAIVAAKYGETPFRFGIVARKVLFDVSVASALGWLGIGSILMRRWARALFLVFFSGWLTVGCLGAAALAFTMHSWVQMIRASATASELAPAAKVAMTLISCAIFFIIIPAVGVLFFGGRDAKATCNQFDPVVRWTDRCPVSVLAASIYLMLTAIFIALRLEIYKGNAPIFPPFITGWPAAVFAVTLIVGACYTAWGLFNLRKTSWWMALAGASICGILIAANIAAEPNDEASHRARSSATQVEEAGHELKPSRLAGFSGLGGIYLTILVHLFWIKKHFRPSNLSDMPPPILPEPDACQTPLG